MSSVTLKDVLDSGIKLTPMMRQYSAIKKDYEEHILLFRMGDFYEVFFEDACRAAKLLNITQTTRGKIGEFAIPMAGIPHHAASTYIDRLTGQGLKVAICEQVEDPKDAIGIVKRAVTQVVSPSLPYDLNKTEARENRYICAGSYFEGAYFLLAMDFTTGSFTGHRFSSSELFLEKLRLLAPREFISYMGQWEELDLLEPLLEHMGTLKTLLSSEYFDKKHNKIYIEKLIPGYKRDRIIKLNEPILCPIGAISYYITSTQNGEDYCHIRPFQMINEEDRLKVSLPTLVGLEILANHRERYHDSLLGFMDSTKTAMGARALRSLFLSPLTDQMAILERQAMVSFLIENSTCLEETRDELAEVRDLERILAKIGTGKATASDLLNLAAGVEVFSKLKNLLKKAPKIFGKNLRSSELSFLLELATEIRDTINDELGASLDKGNLIKPGHSKKRDRLAKLNGNACDELVLLEEKYRKKSGIPKLRVKSNNVAGYFIEISKVHSAKVPANFERRQTLVNSERYTTPELNDFEKDIISAKEKLERLERELFKSLLAKIADNGKAVLNLAGDLAQADCFQSLGHIALRENFCKPSLSSENNDCQIKGAWHPLIKAMLKDQFVCHDLKLDSETYFGLITGPNMAGKTTVMREVAIITLLAQIGSYVPAATAHISLCDYLFSRLGASDDILKGQSTFMVEMSETAEILRHATPRSLIILDEVGRGTSTYDGLSIAWGLVEYLVQKTKATTLFATHYHELIEVVENLPGAKNFTVETMSNGGEVQFLYRLIEKGASQSFGIYVAKLAGLPKSILTRSQALLNNMEEQNPKARPKGALKKSNQLSFFEEPQIEEVPQYLRELEGQIDQLDPHNLTPIEALVKLSTLKQKMVEQKSLQ
ncbi:MAG: DNA mismatch repair protein MutS [Halobacteriovoraceae bacterium]|nr:DNA mismatch repair protein MutS [Halobacteriovoraceae bacterium]